MTATIHRRTVNGALLLVLGTLGACGQSDLPEHHQAVLACAEVEQAGGSCESGGGVSPAAAEPDSGAATPGSGESGSGTATTGSGSTDPDPSAGGDGETTAASTGNSGSTDGTDGSQGTVAPGEESVQGLDIADYELVFSDEFQTLTLDATKWTSALEWGPDLTINDELQYYVDIQSDPEFGYDPFVLDGEMLTIRAQRTPERLLAAANDQPWLSGVLSSAGHFDVQYGYVETRVDLPAGTALSSAFWMLPVDLEGLRPRIFIGEHDGGHPTSLVHDYRYENQPEELGYTVEEPALADGFHTLGLSWTPDELVFYLDGQARYRVVGDRLPAQRMYPILNLAIGGTEVGDPDAQTPTTPELLVDYVRVWQLR